MSVIGVEGTGSSLIGIFLDTETTGLNADKHRMVEIALMIVNLRTQEVLGSFESVIYQPREVMDAADQRALQVNGFSWETVQNGIREEEVAAKIIEIFESVGIRKGEAIFICQNPSFDRKFFEQIIPPEEQDAKGWPYHWLDLASMHFTCQYQQRLQDASLSLQDIRFSKDSIAKHYGLPPEDKPHKAMNGVRHLISCFNVVNGIRQAATL